MHHLLLGLSICVGGYLFARAFLYLREDSTQSAHKVLGTLCESVQECALELCFPQYMTWEHSVKIEKSDIMGELSALVKYLQKNTLPETSVEDSVMTKEIIKLHNKWIQDEIFLENQMTGNHKQEQSDDSSIIDGELPVWAQITEDSVKNTISIDKLKNFNYLMQQFFVVDADTTVGKNMFSVEQWMREKMLLKKEKAPQILIYHTHSQEGYADSVLDEEETTVVGVGNYLAKIMEEVFGYQVIHVKEEFDIQDGYLDRNHAYDYALPVIEEVLKKYPTIEVVIDLHRDGVAENRRLVTEINGKPTAQIMFFNGLSRKANGEARGSIPNPYLNQNLAFSFRLAYEAKTYYPDFLRCVYLKGYRYNLHVRPRALLLEVGAQTNTVEEAKNAMEPFSVILNKVLNEE